MRNKDKIEMLENQISTLQNQLNEFKRTTIFLSEHQKDEVIVKKSVDGLRFTYLLNYNLVSVDLAYIFYYDDIIKEYKKLDKNQIIYSITHLNSNDCEYYLLDKTKKDIKEISNLIKEISKVKRVRKVKDENKTEKPKPKKTKTTKRNKL